ncbi:MAG: AmmeMemoRadiSam system protein B [Candidatus Babeliales bacterium]
MRFSKFKTLVLLIIFISAACSKDSDNKKITEKDPIIHSAHLTDGWYPQNEITLTRTLKEYFTQAKKEFGFVIDPMSVKGLIVPHAGMYYSGLCAAATYQSLLLPNGEKNDKFKNVIILAPSHTTFVNGVALPDYSTYKTVLGEIKIDTNAIRILSKSEIFTVMKEAHDKEHAIEIQLPFLQEVLNDFKIVPLIVGNLTEENLAKAVQQLQKIVDDKTLIIVSSDFTHHGQAYDYKPFTRDTLAQVRYLDSVATYLIATHSVPNFDKFLRDTGVTICGANPIRILMGLVHLQSLGQTINTRLACYYTSAQLANARSGLNREILDQVQDDKNNNIINTKKLLEPVEDKLVDNSVSYAGLILTDQKTSDLNDKDQFTEFEKQSLLRLVRDKIENEFKPEETKLPDHILYPIITPALQKTCGAFVTLNTKQGNLRGCIGRMISDLSLFQVIGEIAVACAFHDDRFSPVKKDELENIVVDITILTDPQKVENYQDIKIGSDGIVLKKIGSDGQIIASSVFLPQVPPSLGWDLQTTLEQLSQKAGLGKHGWKENCEFEVFQGFEIKEN